MKIEIVPDANYKVTKYTETKTIDYGTVTGADVKALLKGYTYDADYDMFFSKACTIGYSVTKAF